MIILDIKVLGLGCANCVKLEGMVKEVISQYELEATVEKITDYNRYADFGVLLTPGLVVNGRVLSSGKMPMRSTLEHWLLDMAKVTN